MRSVIWDINEMTDSTEVYESRPNPFLAGTIYLVLAAVLVCLLWMRSARIDVAVKGNGTFRGNADGVNVGCGMSGKIKSCDVKDGQYVVEGQTLFTVEADSLEDSIKGAEAELAEVNERIAILQKYRESLDGDMLPSTAMTENRYHDEFKNRRELLEKNIAEMDKDTAGQRLRYQAEMDSVESSLERNTEKEGKIKKAVDCVKQRKNTFGKNDSYYHSLVKSYITNYKNTSFQYDRQIEACQNNLDGVDGKTEEVGEGTEVESLSPVIETVASEIESCQRDMEKLKEEKKLALQKLESEQVTALEQERAATEAAIQSLKSDISILKAQMDALDGTGKERAVMTEKGSIDAELLAYENKKRECGNRLESLMTQDGNCRMKAAVSGYVVMRSDVELGQYVQQGMELCQILPEKNAGYYAEVYIENKDVAKLREGQKVRIEAAAYPSREYGYFTGTLESLSKDVREGKENGITYYVAKVSCDKTAVTNKKGETGTLQNGMACQAKIIVDAQRVWDYVLQKIKLTD